jgi:hypothetical protein
MRKKKKKKKKCKNYEAPEKWHEFDSGGDFSHFSLY